MLTTEYEIHCLTDFTIAVVADLHEHNPAPVLSILRSVNPDVIAIPGDLMERWEHVEKKDRSIFSLVIGPVLHFIDHFFRFGRKDDVSKEYAYDFLREADMIAPVLYSYGNHELEMTKLDKKIIEQTGTTVMNNLDVWVKGVHFAGIPSIQSTGEIAYNFLKRFKSSPSYKVLLCHHPEYYEKVGQYADLMLSGHCMEGK